MKRKSWIFLVLTSFLLVATAHSQTVERGLVKAALDGRLADVRELVAKGVDLSNGRALMAAVSGGHFDVVKFLMEKGANPNRMMVWGVGGSTTIFYEAADKGHRKILKYMVAHGADPNYEDPGDTTVISTPLLSAVYHGELNTIQLLIESGADVNYVSKKGNTALSQALRFVGEDSNGDKAAAIIKLLLVNGADPDKSDGDGITPRQYAQSSRHPGLAALIEKTKAAPPGTVRASADDIQRTGMVLVFKEYCDQKLPGFREKSAPAYQAWRSKNADLIRHVENNAAFEELMARARDDIKKSSWAKTPGQVADEARQMKETCEDGILQKFKRDLSGPDPQLATPEKTWEHYLESLRKADRKAALSCLASNARRNFRKVIEKAPDELLRKMGESVKSFRITTNLGDMVEGTAALQGGRGGSIEFQNIDGEWKITDM